MYLKLSRLSLLKLSNFCCGLCFPVAICVRLILPFWCPLIQQSPHLILFTSVLLLNPRHLVPPYLGRLPPFCGICLCRLLRSIGSGDTQNTEVLSTISSPPMAWYARHQLSTQCVSKDSDILSLDFLSPNLSRNSLVS